MIAGVFFYLYFQCSEVGRVKWHISEECFCRGFNLKLLKKKRVEISPCCLTSRPGRIDVLSLADASEFVPITMTADVTPPKEAGGEKPWMGISHLSPVDTSGHIFLYLPLPH